MRRHLALPFALLTLASPGCAALGVGVDAAATDDLEVGSDRPAGWLDPGPWLGGAHEAHAGQVLFSTRPIAAAAAAATGVVTEAALGDALYVRFFGRDSLYNAVGPECSESWLSLGVSVNGGERTQIWATTPRAAAPTELAAGELGSRYDVPTTTATELDPDKTARDPERGVALWNGRIVPQLRDGVNDVHVVVTAVCRRRDEAPVLAEGTLRLTVAPGARAKYAKRYGPKLPKATLRESKAVVAGLTKAVEKEWPGREVVGGVVTSEDWIVGRDQVTGAPLKRSVATFLVVRERSEPNPAICRAYRVWAKQAKTQGGWAREIAYAGMDGSEEVSCDIAR